MKVLKADFRDYDQDLELTVWIDTTHGHLPRRIEVFEKARRFVTWRYDNDELREVAPNVWLALRGSDTGYYVKDFTLPAGMTKEQFKKLKPAEFIALLPKLTVIPGTLGMGMQTWIIDQETLRINQPIPRSRFVPDYPEGAGLYDTTHDPPLQYRFKASRTPEEWREIIIEGEKRAKVEKNREAAEQALMGKPAVEFPPEAAWINSKPLRLADLTGKLIFLDFWSEWCGPCRSDLPGMADLHKKRDQFGITIIGVHPVGSDRAAIDKVVDEFHLGFPIVIDTPGPQGAGSWGSLFAHYSVSRIPHAILIDRQGKVVAAGPPGEVFGKIRQFADEAGSGR